ncbi:SH3 domain-containing protein, partial [Vibrio parahaemolyticus]|uniref:SH3 domain-containing protein n=1 Tax=Vibrio parahaemolyticus TaxID=670 RepID=UPI0021138C15
VKTDRPINLRWGATTNSAVITQLPAGSTIKYDAYHNDGTYVWLRQPRSDGSYAYLASRNAKTHQPWEVFK